MAEFSLEDLGLVSASKPGAKPATAPVEYTPEELGLTQRVVRGVSRGPLTEAGGEVAKAGFEAYKGMTERPLQTLAGIGPGLVESGAGVVAGMGLMAGAGITGVAGGLRNLLSGKSFEEGFTQSYQNFQEGSADIPIHPETTAGKFFTSLINLVPAAMLTTGSVAFQVGRESEGAAKVAAGIDTLTMAAAMKGALPKVFGDAFKGGGGARGKAARDAFDELAKTDPAQARDTARNLGAEDPALKKELDKRIDSLVVTKKQVKAMPQAAARPAGVAVSEMDVNDMFKQARENRVQEEAVTPTPEPTPAAPPAGVGERRAEPRGMPDQGKLDQQLDEVNARRSEMLNDPAKAGQLEELNQQASRLGYQRAELARNAKEAEKLMYGPGPQLRATSAAVKDTLDTPGVGVRDPFKGPGRGQAGAVKPPGGMWHPEAVERLADPLYGAMTPGTSIKHLGKEFDPTMWRSKADWERAVKGAEWTTSRIKSYLNKYAGTERDPLKDVEIPAGEGVKRWEEVADAAFHSREARSAFATKRGPGQEFEKIPPNEPIWNAGNPARDPAYTNVASRSGATQVLTSYLSHVGDYLRQNVPPEKLPQYDLVRAVKETAEADKRAAKEMEKAAVGSMKDLPVYKEYPDGMKWVELKLPEKLTEEQEKGVQLLSKAAKSGAMRERAGEGYVAVDAQGKPVRNSYTNEEAVGRTPEEAHLAGQLAQEGNQMGHCVGGYCEGVASGESKIYSLRDKKGLSHVTIEVSPEGKINSNRDAPPEDFQGTTAEYLKQTGKDVEADITQIKGKQNRAPNKEYLPYVQDFVKGGKWGEVGDLEGTGLSDIQQSKINSIPFRELAEELYPGKRYLTAEEATHLRNEGVTRTLAAGDRLLGKGQQGSTDRQPPLDPFRGPGRGQRGAISPEPINDAIEAGKKAQTALTHAFTIGKGALREFPGVEALERELKQSFDVLIRSVAPESRGPEAKTAAAVLGSAMAKQARADSVRFYSSEPRRRFWDQLGPEQSRAFRDQYEAGKQFQDPTLQKAAEGYRNWSEEIYQAEKKAGIEYDPIDNYLTHLYQDREGVARYLHSKYGAKWNNPYFMKERGFEMYAAAEKAGYKAKYWNPEEIMLAREHSSNVAQMKIQALQDLKEFGVARQLKQGQKLDVGETEWRAPNGERFAVGDQANQVLHNAFNTASLWSMEGPVGATFRAAMLMKNTILPIKLMSLFHPVHVATMQGADALVVATKGFAADKAGVGNYTLDAIGNMYFKNLVGVSRQGYRLRQVWEGKVPESELTVADKRALQWMEEGGFIADLSPELKTNWTTSFTKAVDQGKYGSAAFKLPFYLLETVFQKPVMEIWIPSLKTAAYVNAAAKALEAAPELLENRQARMEAFRKLQKSVDNRFGEMQYGTTFMNRTVKDIGVGSLLSLGWQLGFLREYGGAAGEAYKGAKNPLEIQKMTAKGDLDRALFVTFYTTQAMMLGGLMTYALTGETPSSLLDYIYPRTGDVDKDGKPERVSTPYYTREFMAVSKHVAQEGLGAGMAHLVGSKLSPAIGIVKAWATNLDFFGKEISDPDTELMKQVGQKVAWTLGELEPLMTSAAKRRPRDLTAKDIALGAAGFSPAPAYATKTETEAAISSTFQRYHKSATPYERAEFGPDNAKLRTYLAEGDGEKFNEQAAKMREKYNLSSAQMQALRRGLRGDPNVKMFKALTDTQQVALLKKMPAEDRETYERHARPSARARLED